MIYSDLKIVSQLDWNVHNIQNVLARETSLILNRVLFQSNVNDKTQFFKWHRPLQHKPTQTILFKVNAKLAMSCVKPTEAKINYNRIFVINSQLFIRWFESHSLRDNEYVCLPLQCDVIVLTVDTDISNNVRSMILCVPFSEWLESLE